jgi:hypothetical protein
MTEAIAEGMQSVGGLTNALKYGPEIDQSAQAANTAAEIPRKRLHQLVNYC